MKKIAKTAMYTVLIFGTMTIQSCKDKPDTNESSENGGMVTDTVPPDGMTSKPVADTIVKGKDTIVSMKDVNKGKDNVAGEQVP